MTNPQQPVFNAPAPQGKSRVTAGLLNFFLGGIGGGDFYLGHKKIALIKILVLVVSYGLITVGIFNQSAALSGLGFVMFSLYGIAVFVCMILTFMGKWIYEKDANGVPTV